MIVKDRWLGFSFDVQTYKVEIGLSQNNLEILFYEIQNSENR